MSFVILHCPTTDVKAIQKRLFKKETGLRIRGNWNLRQHVGITCLPAGRNADATPGCTDSLSGTGGRREFV